MLENKSYNRLALQGWDEDDMDVCKDHNLDPMVAYSNAINLAMCNNIYKKNIESGMPPTEAGRIRAKVTKDINTLLKKRGLSSKVPNNIPTGLYR